MFSRCLAPTIALTVLMISSNAFAQEDERYFNGPYISGSIGLESVEDSRNDSIVFDTNGDGTFNDTVSTVDGADAFSPGFCAGTPAGANAAGCRGNRQNEGYAVRLGYDRHLDTRKNLSRSRP